MGGDEGLSTKLKADPCVDQGSHCLVFDQGVESAAVLFRQANGTLRPLGPVGLILEDCNPLFGAEKFTGRFEIGEQGAGVCSFVLVDAVGSDFVQVFRGDILSRGDVTDPTQILPGELAIHNC